MKLIKHYSMSEAVYLNMSGTLFCLQKQKAKNKNKKEDYRVEVAFSAPFFFKRYQKRIMGSPIMGCGIISLSLTHS